MVLLDAAIARRDKCWNTSCPYGWVDQIFSFPIHFIVGMPATLFRSDHETGIPLK